MASDTLKKIRAWLGFALLTLFTPIILFISVLIYFYDNYVRSRVCKNIAGEVAVVTGAAGGLGKCIAAELAAKGCHVAICDINFDLAVATAKEIADRYGVKAKAYKVDVTNYDEIVELNEKLTTEIGAATILVNNAGLLLHSDQLNPTVEEIELMVKVNYLSHYLTNRVFLPNMKKAKRGHIVAISSVSGLVLLPLAEPYCSAKTAVRTLMRVLRAELRLNNITGIGVTTVFPSFLKTHSKVEKLARDSGYAEIYPLLNGEEVARRTVRGMLRGEVEIAMPEFFMFGYRFMTQIMHGMYKEWTYCGYKL
ncbi:17-beta-hydroxysteroid dehydrogenase 13-like isoform X2 [Zeugodacus cucurbitae]|uniref:17-beta-hydroxysteroid dehydrogenase 13-like isoform X2 n=1 Tax=Zeugodacus cucurbitae TaxID=28588 RepID=UPI0023D93A8A|nr:17-beta-hydroxysteroid dehydrogenase 13-like isoform X2 [Zeugodacus cucurbitae]